jgi:hypothetical protein
MISTKETEPNTNSKLQNFRPLKEPSNSSRKSWMKIVPRDLSSKKREEDVQWTFGILKANMFFQFPREEAELCSAVCCLDGCTIDAELKKTRKQIPVWKVSNPLILSNPTRELFSGCQTVAVYFKSGREMEEWYYALKRATTLTKQTIEQRKQQEYWALLSSRLLNVSNQVDPDWLNAIVSRIFYNIYDTENFINFLLKKIRKKIKEVQTPSYVNDISVSNLYFGPNLPILKSAELISISNDGSMEAAGEFVYYGGFRITIEITFKITFPGSRIIFVPATLTVTVQKAAGKAHFHCDSPPASCFWLGFYGEPEIDLTVQTEIGENYKIKQIPKLADVIVNKLKQEIIELMVLPNMDDFPFPKISNPLKPIPAPLKRVESEPIMNATTQTIALTEEPVPNLNHRQLLENIDKQFADFIDSETRKNKKEQ